MLDKDTLIPAFGLFLFASGLATLFPSVRELIHWMEAWSLGSWFTYRAMRILP